jgi:glutamine synthetase
LLEHVSEPGVDATHERLRELVRERGIETLELAVPDTLGALRGKRVPARLLREDSPPHVALSTVIYVWDVAADVVGAPFSNWDNGFPDFELVPDAGTLRALPWRPGSAFVLCDAVGEDGEPLAFSPRHVLRRVVESARAAGYEPTIGPELEFYLLPAGTRMPPGERIPCYSLNDPYGLESVVGAIRTQLADAGVTVEASNAEYAAGQIEVNLRSCPALQAADDTAFFRYAVREIAAAHGFVATFMAKPFSELSGNGFHVHQSLKALADDANAFAAEDGDAPSPLARAYVAGLLRRLRETSAFGSPTPNAYRRRFEASFAPTNVSWGLDNRTVAVRVPPAATPAAARVEQRDAAADANPYLVIAAQVAAGLAGVRDGLEPPPRIDGNAYEARDCAPLPTSLDDAARLLAGSEFAREIAGDALVDVFVSLLEHESELARASVSEWERERYLEAC